MKFLGTIEYIDFELLTKLFGKLFPNEEVKSKVRVIGEEVNIDSERIEIYSYNQHHEPKFYFEGKCSFIVQGDIKSDLLNSLKVFNEMINSIRRNGYHYNCDIYPDTEDESFELYFKSTGFEIFMNDMKRKITEANM